MTRAEHPMTRRVVVVPPEMPLSACWKVMQREGFRHLPVARGDEVMGMLSDRDVFKRATLHDDGSLEVPSEPVAMAMSAELHVCQPSTHVADLVRIMTERTIDAVVVVEDERKLVGIVTSTDLLLLLIELDAAKAPLPFDFELETHSGVT
jgi:CBS domain-containing protein